jgi:hypothetical protein
MIKKHRHSPTLALITGSKWLIILFFGLFSITTSYAQVGISTTSITPDASSVLELRSTTTGFLPPRMTTTQRDAISSPATGLLVYNTTTSQLNYYTGSAWQMISVGSSGTVTSASVTSANGLSGTVANATTTPAITLSTSVNGIAKGNGTALSAATAGTDYSVGTSALATGILKSTTTTGALSIAVAGDFPTLNQNTTGNAATVTTNANLTGDVTSVGNATTLATVNSNIGTFNSVTVNGKGLITAASNASYALTTNPISQFAATTSAQLAGVLSDETGTGLSVFSTSPTLTTPILGVASSTSQTITGTGGTGFLELQTQSSVPATGPTNSIRLFSNSGQMAWKNQSDGFVRNFASTLTADRTYTLPDVSSTLATTANKLSAFAATTSAELTTVLPDETGTGSLVFANSPTLVTPTLGVANATSLGITGTGGNGFISLATQSATPASIGAGTVLFSNSNSKFSWRGSANTFVKTFDGAAATADRIYTLPDAAGTIPVTASGNIALSTLGDISFTGILPVANGGTNSTSTPTNGGIVYGTGTAIQYTAAGASGQVLTSNGAAAPSWINGGTMMLTGISNNTSVNNTTLYFPINGALAGNAADLTAGNRTLVSRSGNISNLTVRISAALGAGKTGTVTLMKNGVATLLIATLSVGPLTFTDNTDAISVVAGDELTIKITTTGNVKFSWAADFTY